MSLENEAALGLPQLGLKFLADGSRWTVNGTPNLNCEADAQSTESAGLWQLFLHSLAYLI